MIKIPANKSRVENNEFTSYPQKTTRQTDRRKNIWLCIIYDTEIGKMKKIIFIILAICSLVVFILYYNLNFQMHNKFEKKRYRAT